MPSAVYEKYGDILFRERPRSGRHIPMSRGDRAAQFAPFAALTGYDAVIQETARQTDPETELDPSEIEMLDRKLHELLEQKTKEVIFLCFRPDERKSGGSICRISGIAERVDPVRGELHLKGGTVLQLAALRGIIETEEKTWTMS